MPGTTSDGWPYSLGSDKGYTIDETSQAVANRLKAFHTHGTKAERVASAHIPNKEWRESDTGDVYVSTGSAWVFLRSDALAIYGSGADVPSSSDTMGRFGGAKSYNHVIFDRVNSGGDNPSGLIYIGEAGRYEMTGHVRRADPFTAYLRTVNHVTAPTQTVPLDERTGNTNSTVALRGALNIDAGWFVQIKLSAISGSSPFVVQDFHIRRVGP